MAETRFVSADATASKSFQLPPETQLDGQLQDEAVAAGAAAGANAGDRQAM